MTNVWIVFSPSVLYVVCNRIDVTYLQRTNVPTSSVPTRKAPTVAFEDEWVFAHSIRVLIRVRVRVRSRARLLLLLLLPPLSRVFALFTTTL